MKKLSFLLLLISIFGYAQKFKMDTLLTDKISIRAIQLWDGKVWYSGTDSKFGFINLKDRSDKKQVILSEKKLQFRTLAQDETDFYMINIESPAYFFKVDKKTLKSEIFHTDSAKTAFYDSFVIQSKNLGISISDPNEDGFPKYFNFNNSKNYEVLNYPKYDKGEAHFAASNTNIAMNKSMVWIATGGKKARIFKFNWSNPYVWEVFETPFIQGTSSQGIYSIDFHDKNFGIAVGGDYTKQADNINNIATTNDGGKTWQIQASGQNAGYMTCVKFRPKTKGREIVAVGDQHISFSSDYGKTWVKISDEKNLYACEWADKNTLILAGKDKIVRLSFQ
ncbi:glycosyl hydrolase [Epilithonimonas ginsengisoli]|uniref:Glycosyl hydrolase n=1 Tax=Epilithonimonas ginsengisoli TaxID=1245592 RepID=A0ABU4JKZ3_9FLAO|nr:MULTISPECIES: hypothetical protein [Chryseobacterium group]MBV6881372.1 glycosyl hydrolase [Epilithonimonas sp. FP105]MDW8550340.1 glycosyl hydrolase [Epilithonimonas ginsengisoli]OAH68306.1 glycosyl hydrolase [Chryseobacterium sp. FP211-J200]